MKRGWVYGSPRLYELIMWALYRSELRGRYERVAAHIPEGSSVIDLCAGTGFLFQHLRDRAASYTAVEIHPGFVARSLARFVSAVGGRKVSSFTEASLRAALSPLSGLRRMEVVSGGKDLLAVFTK